MCLEWGVLGDFNRLKTDNEVCKMNLIIYPSIFYFKPIFTAPFFNSSGIDFYLYVEYVQCGYFTSKPCHSTQGNTKFLQVTVNPTQ